MRRQPLAWRGSFPALGLLLAVFVVEGCRSEGGANQNQPVAKVQDHYLYQKDVDRFFAHKPELSQADSVQLRQQFINQWISEQLIFFRAKEELPDSLLQKDEQLRRYYRKLLRHDLERKWVAEKLDSSLSREAIRDFYAQNKAMFRRHEPMVKAVALKIPLPSKRLEQYRRWSTFEERAYQDSLYKYATGMGEAQYYISEDWQRLSALDSRFDFDLRRHIASTKQPQAIDTTLGDHHLIVRLMEYRPAGEIPPLEEVRGRIVSLLLNRRKVELLQRMEERIFNQARNQNDFQIIKP